MEDSLHFRANQYRATQFLLRMEELLDHLHFPQPFQAVRSFGEPPLPGAGADHQTPPPRQNK